jgi:glycosyltransferase involved in cell wall biosynthesis
MRILEINKFNFANRGADKHFLDIVDLLKSKGHKVVVFSMKHPRNHESYWEKYFVSGVGYTDEYNFWQKIKGILRMFYSLEAKRKINRLLDDFQPNIVHIHNIYHQLSPAILFEIKKRGIPIAMTVHDYKLINPNHNLYLSGKTYDRCHNGKYYQCFLDKAVKNSYIKSFLAMLEIYWHNSILKTYEKNIDLYITPSVFVKNILTEWGIGEEKIIVLPHFIPSESEKNNSTDIPLLPINRISESYALYSGHISKDKGTDVLIDIFKNISGGQLYLAGSADSNMDWRGIYNVKHLGHLEQNKLKEFLQNAKFVISGSRLPETFGLAALEAIGQGKPFIGFKTGAYPEIIKNGVNGFLAENEEEMKEVIKKIIGGKINFDSEKILKEAQDTYNHQKYYQNIMKIFDSLTP